MISTKWLKLIKSLQVKKYRKIHQAFLVEGAKSVQELIQSDFEVMAVFATQTFYQEHIRLFQNQSFEHQVVKEDELAKIGSFQSNNACLAVAKAKLNEAVTFNSDEFGLVLDGIQDPGNVGTIVRIADWYGINKVICSDDTADIYNPKVISASMGSFTRVQTYYCDLVEYLKNQKSMPVYGAFLEGQNVHGYPFAPAGLVVMGNESQGIREPLQKFIRHKIHIPRYGGAESLNVGIATAIICDNLRRIARH
jgi:TrmH family RNA methyltransferase